MHGWIDRLRLLDASYRSVSFPALSSLSYPFPHAYSCVCACALLLQVGLREWSEALEAKIGGRVSPMIYLPGMFVRMHQSD